MTEKLNMSHTNFHKSFDKKWFLKFSLFFSHYVTSSSEINISDLNLRAELIFHVPLELIDMSYYISFYSRLSDSGLELFDHI